MSDKDVIAVGTLGVLINNKNIFQFLVLEAFEFH